MVHDAINNFVHRKQRKILYFTLSRRNVEVKKKKKDIKCNDFCSVHRNFGQGSLIIMLLEFI